MSTTALPRVIIDARMVGPVGHGIAKYVELLAQGLSKLNSRQPLPYEPVFLVRPGVRFADFQRIELDVPFLDPRELFRVPLVLLRAHASLYHSPSFSSLLWSPCKTAVTVHDLIHLSFGSLRDKAYYELLLKRFIRRSRAVMTVSKFSRGEVSRWAGVPETEIEVVYNPIERNSVALSSAELGKELSKLGLEKGRYFLSLSSAKPHKNLELLLRAYDRYRRESIGTGQTVFPLVIATAGFPAQDGVIALGGLDEKKALHLLRGAGALFYPSLLEGFGRPPLEAALEGVPVAVSRIPPHEEALESLSAGEVCWVEPRDLEGWVTGFQKATRGEIRPASQTSREKIASALSTASMAEHMDRIYRRVLGIKA